MALSYSELESLRDCLEKELVGERLSKFCHYANEVFSFHLTNRKSLAIVLDNNNPYVYISPSFPEGVSLSSYLATTFRKQVSNASITAVSLLNGDRILAFSLLGYDAAYNEVPRTLIVELIPSKANLILLDEENKVLVSLKPRTLEDERPLLRQMLYVPPRKNEFQSQKENKGFSYNDYLEKCLLLEGKIEERRRQERYHALFTYLKKKEAASERKIKAIEKDIENASSHLDDGRFGDYIYTNCEDLSLKMDKLETEEGTISLHEDETLQQNAERFYQRAKKAKKAIEAAKGNLKKAEEERKTYQNAHGLCQDADEALLEELADRFRIHKVTPSKKKASLISSANLPYIVKHEGTTYLFGKNAAQNDFLTFLFDTSKLHTWMHIKDTTGAHLMIRKEKATPEEISFGAEICLLQSGKEDGEVIYCLRKEVRKGSKPGEAILNHYETIFLRGISEEARLAFKEAKKIEV